MLADDLLRHIPVSKQLKDEIDGNAQATNRSFTFTDFWIYCDAIECHTCTVLDFRSGCKTKQTAHQASSSARNSCRARWM